MPRPARASRDRILAVAAREFAARGFAGARVDRIARRANVNKAMLYYHFESKQGLYRALLRDMFTQAAERMQRIAASNAAPADKIDQVLAGIAALVEEHASFPSIMLREVAEGGVHLDRETLAALAAVPKAVTAIVHQGIASGAFRPIHPLFAYFSMLPPIVFYLAGAPILKEMTHLRVAGLDAPSPAEFVKHMQQAVRRAFAPDGRAARPTS